MVDGQDHDERGQKLAQGQVFMYFIHPRVGRHLAGILPVQMSADYHLITP